MKESADMLTDGIEGARTRESFNHRVIAINQPYFLPYIGYLKLLEAADQFVVLDTVNFRPRSWITRNYLKSKSGALPISIPIRNGGQSKKIFELEVVSDKHWREKMLRTAYHNYRGEKFFDEGMTLLEKIIYTELTNLSQFLGAALSLICEAIGVECHIMYSSNLDLPKELAGQDRILEILHRTGASAYVNLPNGRELYSAEHFRTSDIGLHFVRDIVGNDDCLGHFTPEDLKLSVLHLIMKFGSRSVSEALSVLPIEPKVE